MSALKYYDTTSGTWKYLAQGVKGDKGDKGDTGNTGNTGPQGPTGPTGPAGISSLSNLIVKALSPETVFPTANSSLITSTSSTAISGATVYSYDSGKFTFRGLNPTVITNGSSSTYYRNSSTGTTTTLTPTYWVEFDYYGTNFDVRYNQTSTASAQIWIWVDGVPVTSSANVISGTANVDRYYNVLLPSSAQRRIRVMLHRADFGGIGLKDVTETISPTNQKLTKVVLYDGSWFAAFAGGSNALIASNSLPVILGELMNVDYYISTIPSTGYVRGTNVDPILGYVTDATAGGPSWVDSGRLSTVKTIAPDLIIFLGSTNDDNYTGSTYRLQDHATYVYDYFKTNLPNTKLIVFTRQSNTDTATINGLNASYVYTAAQAATNVIGAVNVYSENWVTGTGDDSSPANNGNADIFMANDLHLNVNGNKYYANRMFSRIINIIKTSLGS
jgi:hypothetical protein